MSTETAAWLNNNTLIGQTDKRGNAWHYRAELQGAEPNHYTGAIPVADVKRRLFDQVTVVTTNVVGELLTPDGVTRFEDPTSKTLWRAETGQRFGTFKAGFQIHDYYEWLVTGLGTLLDDDVTIASAGLLKGGALAWVQAELPDTFHGPEGFDFRPYLTGATALDGTLSSTYTTGAQAVVCDNTLTANLSGSASVVKIKHSAKSLGRIGEIRDALQLLTAVADDFSAQVAGLLEVKVTDKQWEAFLQAHRPMPVEAGRGRTMAGAVHDDLNRLWRHDPRVAPWTGTAFGVLQAVNTREHHLVGVRGANASSASRNALRAVTGGVDKLDNLTMATLDKVLASV